MTFETFELERNQSLFENTVEFNLTESGVEPLQLSELLSQAEQDELLAIRPGYGHTDGTPELRAAIASWYPGASSDNVLVTTGAAEANFIAYWAMMRRGDALALMLPNFLQWKGLAAAFGHEVRPVLLMPTAAGWSLDRVSLAAATRDGHARLIVICNPNNPTGAILDRAEREAIAAAAEGCGAWIVCDEIYRGSELDARGETPTFFGQAERVIVTASTSKSLAHAGLRIGWMVAPREIIAAAMERQDYTTIGTGPINQFLAARVMQRREAMLARGRGIIGRNAETIEAWIASWGGRLSWRRPMAGGMAFISYDFAIGSAELSRRIREAQSVFVAAGAWFGMEGYLRLSTGGEPEHLKEALARVDRVLAAIVKESGCA
ncbi:MAG TPA: aminotransferase class I/II-fold pyridoxal phosphate-dependent enzyme [Caulobacteraceae bacterium]|nr:aminotransferase class I/II-fold pyridoxal phosphate-dependent enzyme [Caulobacteraceae bacterium]